MISVWQHFPELGTGEQLVEVLHPHPGAARDGVDGFRAGEDVVILEGHQDAVQRREFVQTGRPAGTSIRYSSGAAGSTQRSCAPCFGGVFYAFRRRADGGDISAITGSSFPARRILYLFTNPSPVLSLIDHKKLAMVMLILLILVQMY
jgi:hypothetical protein